MLAVVGILVVLMVLAVVRIVVVFIHGTGSSKDTSGFNGIPRVGSTGGFEGESSDCGSAAAVNRL